jgi:hypothetical protein
VLFVGTTGAGKTSLLRHLIGSDPDEDRFPSTAPAKTTIADIEVIQTEGDFDAAVTFFTEFQTQANIEECIIDAALAVLETAPLDKVADRFLSHRDQKFRLSYILGGWQTNRTSDEQDEMSFDEASESTAVLDDEVVLTEAERAANREAISGYLERIADLTKSVVAKLTGELGVDIRVAGPDRDTAQQLIEENFESHLTQEESFHELVQDILEDVRSRFDLIAAGQLHRRPSGWPELWVFSSTDRDEFIRHIRWFSSNYWPQFGRLLTPLVDGIRVRGPLFPDFLEGQPRLVLIDGQGLGHTPNSSSSVTRVTRRFGQVDVILLVDNAQQPMQAAPLSVLRAVASSGHHRKLAVAFTHFDQIKGQNFQKFADKRAHVMASVLNALSSLRDVLGLAVVNAIERGIDARCFMLGGVDRQLAKLPARAADYMRAQLTDLGRSTIRQVSASPFRNAVNKFQGPWLARLGIGTYEGFRKEHWTRVKALNRRIAGELDDEYDTLRPIADLATQLRESISRFLNNPIELDPPAS